MANIIYDMEKLQTAKSAIDALQGELTAANKMLTQSLEVLKEQWSTPAGETFFEEHKDTWTVFVSKYTQKLDGISDMLDKAIEEYEHIANEVKNLEV